MMSTNLVQNEKLFITFKDCDNAFDKVDHGLLWQKPRHAQRTGKVLRVIPSLQQKTKACV